jgi:serine/threonine-protein kinase RsbT
LPLRCEADVAEARRRARVLAQARGLRFSDSEALATALSEVARNVLVHAGGGEILLGSVSDAGRVGVIAIARDEGPGIADIEQAMRDGYSSGDGLGLGLPSAQRLVDEFELHSVVGQGTRVSLTKWAPSAG